MRDLERVEALRLSVALALMQACVVLTAFTAGALALTAVAARRKQVWTLDRLHPELRL